MLNTTLSHLSCPRKKKNRRCGGDLVLSPEKKSKVGNAAIVGTVATVAATATITTTTTSTQAAPEVFEVSTGELKCCLCGAKFPILGGVAVVVADVRDYLLTHVKGIAQVVADSEIPREYQREFLEAKAEIQTEHIEEDLEAERVNALYLMNHYLRVSDLEPSSGKPWWKSEVGTSSALLDKLIREYWDHGPFAQIGKWLSQLNAKSSALGSNHNAKSSASGSNHNAKSSASGSNWDVIELGCGVGGLYLVLKPYSRSYLGVDSSFASIALARHLILGVPGPQGALRIPEDLLAGSVSRPIRLQRPGRVAPGQDSLIMDPKADFIVGDLANLPLRDGRYDLALALNAIDMLDEPSKLPELKFRLLKKDGITVQSSPYIWHEAVAKKLRKRIPKDIKDSAKAVEWLYHQAGFKIDEMCEHLPWLFFKNVRQMEIYSVQIFLARKFQK